MRALVVDDSKTMRIILTKMMKGIGFEDVAQAEHGQHGLEQMEQAVPDVALVDWNMPVMGGLDFIKAVRARPEYERVRILVVTSESNPRIVFEALQAGADEYAMKPITADILMSKLDILQVAS